MYFNELRPDQLNQISKTENITRFPLINSVVSGTQTGKAFIGRSDELFILHKAGFSLIAMKPGTYHEDEYLNLFEDSNLMPAYFHIYDPPQSVIDLATKRRDSFNLRIRKRIQFRINIKVLRSVQNDWVNKTMSGFSIRQVNESNFDKLYDLGLDLENKFWSSKADFLENGLGVCILSEENKPVSVCYSACLVDNIAEIDIKTHPQYLRSGFGQVVASEFIKLSLEKRITPNWDCFDDNYGSIGTAIKNGFEERDRYQFVSVFNKKVKS